MALNRRQRRARKDRRPHAGDTPQQQMRDFLRAPGKLHIVQLPDEKSFVVKVTEREMPLFLTMCQQLRAVLGQCDAIPATPVDASVADAQTIARQTANDPQRIADAQRRQNEYEQAQAAAAAASDNPLKTFQPNVTPVDERRPVTVCLCPKGRTYVGCPEHGNGKLEVDPELEASIDRHPAGRKRSGGRHAKPEPDTTFDKFAATEDKVRAASIELAAAQDAAARAQEAADAANARLAEVYERTGEIHNQRVLGAFTDAAGQAIAEQVENDGLTPIKPEWQISGPGKYTVDAEPVRRVWCCSTMLGEPHVPGCYYEPREDNPIDYTIAAVETSAIDQARQAAIDNALRQQKNGTDASA